MVLEHNACLKTKDQALDGLQHNYAVWVVEDGCADRNPEAHKSNLFDLNAKYADVVNSDFVFAALGC